jgi:hypothetical protein
MKFLKLDVFNKLSDETTHTVILNADEIDELQSYPDGSVISKKDGRMLYVANKLEELQKELMG